MNALESIFRVVVDTSWRMSCLIIVLLALRWILRGRVSPRVFYWIWIVVAIRLLIPLAAPVKWSPFNLAHLTRLDPAGIANRESAANLGLAAATRPPPAAASPIHSSDIRSAMLIGWSPVQWLALAWGTGVAVLMIGRIRAYRRFAWQLKQTGGRDANAPVSLALEAAANGGVPVIISDSVGIPTLHGMFQPRILFPPGMLEQLSPAEIRLIVAHEMGHCERRDLVAQALIHSARILHWFNPLVWIAARISRQDCELACDEHVLRRLGSTEPEAYGATLVKILGMVSHRPKTPLILGIVESRQHMKRRVEMIIANHSPSVTRTVLGLALFGLVGVLGLTRETLAQQTPPVGAPNATAVKTMTQSHQVLVWQATLPSFGDSDYSRAVEAMFSSYEKTAGHPLAPGAKRRVGLKIYTDSGPELATPIPLVSAVIAALEHRGFEDKNIFLVGLSQVRLQQAGFLPAKATDTNPFAGHPVYVIESGQCDKAGWYYDSPLPGRFGENHGLDAKAVEGKSFLDATLFLDTDFWINLPVYTDEPALGVNGALLNATLWNASNTTRFFGSPSMGPAAAAEMSAIPELHQTCVFTLASLQTYQYFGGPVYDSRYIASEPYLWLSADPVMVDSLMRGRLNEWRRRNGLPAIPERIHTLEYAEVLNVGSTHTDNANLIPVGF
ncbi:MAG TPA: M56 family metallopeptidase [Candidatus Saccharimonadales bacterium]|nr:M56 family metallopeptidase [Candidatus Saccharimonadales bacterium]